MILTSPILPATISVVVSWYTAASRWHRSGIPCLSSSLPLVGSAPLLTVAVDAG